MKRELCMNSQKTAVRRKSVTCEQMYQVHLKVGSSFLGKSSNRN